MVKKKKVISDFTWGLMLGFIAGDVIAQFMKPEDYEKLKVMREYWSKSTKMILEKQKKEAQP